jgi:hypothetical protein
MDYYWLEGTKLDLPTLSDIPSPSFLRQARRTPSPDSVQPYRASPGLWEIEDQGGVLEKQEHNTPENYDDVGDAPGYSAGTAGAVVDFVVEPKLLYVPAVLESDAVRMKRQLDKLFQEDLSPEDFSAQLRTCFEHSSYTSLAPSVLLLAKLLVKIITEEVGEDISIKAKVLSNPEIFIFDQRTIEAKLLDELLTEEAGYDVFIKTKLLLNPQIFLRTLEAVEAEFLYYSKTSQGAAVVEALITSYPMCIKTDRIKFQDFEDLCHNKYGSRVVRKLCEGNLVPDAIKEEFRSKVENYLSSSAHTRLKGVILAVCGENFNETILLKFKCGLEVTRANSEVLAGVCGYLLRKECQKTREEKNAILAFVRKSFAKVYTVALREDALRDLLEDHSWHVICPYGNGKVLTFWRWRDAISWDEITYQRMMDKMGNVRVWGMESVAYWSY